ncbi:MAG: hypothetical protein V4754_14925 [Pseudomonadota bacterium]
MPVRPVPPNTSASYDMQPIGPGAPSTSAPEPSAARGAPAQRSRPAVLTSRGSQESVRQWIEQGADATPVTASQFRRTQALLDDVIRDMFPEQGDVGLMRMDDLDAGHAIEACPAPPHGAMHEAAQPGTPALRPRASQDADGDLGLARGYARDTSLAAPMRPLSRARSLSQASSASSASYHSALSDEPAAPDEADMADEAPCAPMLPHPLSPSASPSSTAAGPAAPPSPTAPLPVPARKIAVSDVAGEPEGCEPAGSSGAAPQAGGPGSSLRSQLMGELRGRASGSHSVAAGDPAQAQATPSVASSGRAAQPAELALPPAAVAAVAHMPVWLEGLRRGGVNYLNAMVRDGSVTTLATFLRELTGYAMANSSGMSEQHKLGVSYSIMGLTILMNLASMAAHYQKGTGNLRTGIAQALNASLLTLATGVAAKTETLAAAAPLLFKGAMYCVIRDTLNTFFTQSDARDQLGQPPSQRVAALQGALAAAIAIAVNSGQSARHVISGTGAAAADKALLGALGSIGLYSLVNGAGETLDGGSLAYLHAADEHMRPPEGASQETLRRGPGDVKLEAKARVPTWGQVLDKVGGVMTSRASIFGTLYGLVGAIDNHKPRNPADAANFMNATLGLMLGAFYPIYIGSVSTSPAPPRPRADDSAV